MYAVHRLFVHPFVADIPESVLSSASSPFLFLTLDSALRILLQSFGPQQPSSSITWPCPARHPASHIWHYCLHLSSGEFHGFCYTTSTSFSCHLPSCLSFGLSLLWSFAFRFPRALVWALSPPFCGLCSFSTSFLVSLRCPMCVSTVTHCVRDRYAVTASFIAEWTTGWGRWRGSIYSWRGS